MRYWHPFPSPPLSTSPSPLWRWYLGRKLGPYWKRSCLQKQKIGKRKLTFIEHLLCAKNCAYIITFNPHSNPERGIITAILHTRNCDNMYLVGGLRLESQVGLRSTYSFPRVPCILLLQFHLQLFKSPSCGQDFDWKSSSISGTPQWLDLIHWCWTFFPKRKVRVTWEGMGGKWTIPMGCVCKQIFREA